MLPPAPGAITCPQCGLLHPAVPAGERCPMVKDKTSTGETIDLDNFFIALRNVLVSNIQKGNIKDYKKLLAIILVKVTKFTEKYAEAYKKST